MNDITTDIALLDYLRLNEKFSKEVYIFLGSKVGPVDPKTFEGTLKCLWCRYCKEN